MYQIVKQMLETEEDADVCHQYRSFITDSVNCSYHDTVCLKERVHEIVIRARKYLSMKSLNADLEKLGFTDIREAHFTTENAQREYEEFVKARMARENPVIFDDENSNDDFEIIKLPTSGIQIGNDAFQLFKYEIADCVIQTLVPSFDLMKATVTATNLYSELVEDVGFHGFFDDCLRQLHTRCSSDIHSRPMLTRSDVELILSRQENLPVCQLITNISESESIKIQRMTVAEKRIRKHQVIMRVSLCLRPMTVI